MNEYDSAKIAALLCEKSGFTLANDFRDADFIILNTCSVRVKAEEKLFSDLGRIRALKRKNPSLIIGVGGCVSVQEKENIVKRAPIVDMVFGPQTIHHLPDMYEKLIKERTKTVDVDSANSAIEKFAYFPKPKVTGPIAFVSVMEGCNKFCSYCIVPFTRGREISRPFVDVMKEVEILSSQGVKEINLLGQNVNDYKVKDTSEKTFTLSDLIQEVAKIKEIARIRFTTSHPTAFSDDLIETFHLVPKLANHLHLPVQSGANKILKAMRRGYTKEDYITKIVALRKIRPNISISSDFIVGFPGETEEDFQETMNIIHKIKFDHSFSFIYSPRPFTPAAKLPDDVTLAEKKKRLEILQNQNNKDAMEISKKMIGTIENVIVTGKGRNPKQISGRTENNRVVNFIGDDNLIGKVVPVEITAALKNSLLGAIKQ